MLSTPNRGSRVAELLLYARPGVALWACGNDAYWSRHGDEKPDSLRAGWRKKDYRGGGYRFWIRCRFLFCLEYFEKAFTLSVRFGKIERREKLFQEGLL